MKRILTTIQEKASKFMLLTMFAGALASCDSILEYEEGDCSTKYCVKFKYDYNMDEVDAFAKQVRTVTLYAFDDNNNLVYQKTDEGEKLGEEDYMMNLDFNPEQYHLVAWAGLNNQSFAIPLLTQQQSKIDELKVKTIRRQAVTRANTDDEKGQYLVEQDLFSLWHGEVKKGTPATRSTFGRNERELITTVPLVKNTNSVRIVVAQVNQTGKQIPATRVLNENTFDCSMYDDNGYMNYDNSLLEDNLLTYKPIVVSAEDVSSRAFSPGSRAAVEYNAVVSELSIGRLMKDKKPQLVIKNTKTQEELFRCDNLISYLKLLQLEKYKDRNYSLQEYLDREDNYGIIIFVDENLALINNIIQVNDWVIHLNDTELK